MCAGKTVGILRIIFCECDRQSRQNPISRAHAVNPRNITFLAEKKRGLQTDKIVSAGRYLTNYGFFRNPLSASHSSNRSIHLPDGFGSFDRKPKP